MDFKHRQLDNGLTIIGEVNPNAQSTAVGFFVRTGARDETQEINTDLSYVTIVIYDKVNGKSVKRDVKVKGFKTFAEYEEFRERFKENTIMVTSKGYYIGPDGLQLERSDILAWKR